METIKIKFKEKLGFMTYSAASNIIYNFKGTYFLIFLTAILKMDVEIAGKILTFGMVWDAVNDPIISTIANNTKFKSGEKIRPYALYFPLPFALASVLLFTNFHLNPIWTIVVTSVAYFVYETFYTFIDIPYNSLAQVATSNDEDRESINSFKGLGACIGSGLGTVMIVPLITFFGGLDNGTRDDLNSSDSKAIFLTACFLGILVIFGSLFNYFTSKERIRVKDDDDEKLSIIQGYKILFKCKSWVFNVLYIVCYSCTTAIIMNNITFYAQYVLKDIDLATPILACYLVAAIITAILIPSIDKKIGRKKTSIIPLIIMGLGKLPFIFNPSLFTCCLNAFTTGIGLTTTYIIFNTNRNTISDILEIQNNRRIDSLIAGGDGMIDKISQALAIYIFTKILKNNGFISEAKTQPLEAQNIIINLVGWIPLILCVFSIIVAFIVNPKKQLEELRNKNGIK